MQEMSVYVCWSLGCTPGPSFKVPILTAVLFVSLNSPFLRREAVDTVQHEL